MQKRLIIAAAPLVAASMGACATTDGDEWILSGGSADEGAAATEAEAVADTAQALTGTHKICSGVVPGNFRDSIPVPNGWNTGMCQSWASSIGATHWQLGCLFDGGYSWGVTNGGLPPNNCGW